MSDIIAKAASSQPSYPPIEAGTYNALCYAIVCTGTTLSEVYGNKQTKIVFMWEIPSETIDIDGEQKPRAISATYTLSLNEKANLRKMLESWRGKVFDEEELKGFALSKVLEKPCTLSIINGTNAKGCESAKISAVGKAMKGYIPPEHTINEPIMFNIMDKDSPLNIMDKLPEWLQERIKESDEYKERATAPNSAACAVIDSDEDLPF